MMEEMMSGTQGSRWSQKPIQKIAAQLPEHIHGWSSRDRVNSLVRLVASQRCREGGANPVKPTILIILPGKNMQLIYNEWLATQTESTPIQFRHGQSRSVAVIKIAKSQKRNGIWLKKIPKKRL
jgi:hypothetical protein